MNNISFRSRAGWELGNAAVCVQKEFGSSPPDDARINKPNSQEGMLFSSINQVFSDSLKKATDNAKHNRKGDPELPPRPPRQNELSNTLQNLYTKALLFQNAANEGKTDKQDLQDLKFAQMLLNGTHTDQIEWPHDRFPHVQGQQTYTDEEKLQMLAQKAVPVIRNTLIGGAIATMLGLVGLGYVATQVLNVNIGGDPPQTDVVPQQQQNNNVPPQGQPSTVTQQNQTQPQEDPNGLCVQKKGVNICLGRDENGININVNPAEKNDNHKDNDDDDD